MKTKKVKKIKIDYDSAVNQQIKSKLVEREVRTCFSYEMDQILKSDFGMPLLEDVENLVVYTDEAEEEQQEIYEWWIVSEFLHRKLKEYNEPILEWGNNYYWGRTTTGQAILLDSVISSIAEEMEILEGQKYSWAEVSK